MKRWFGIFVVFSVIFSAAAPLQAAMSIPARLSGGLVVCLGADALTQLSGSWGTESFVFQCLEKDAAEISRLREKIQTAGFHGRVTVKKWDGGKLPYVDELANLVVVSESCATAPGEEITRILAPGGRVLIGGKKGMKPWPKDVDDWNHFLHSPNNNAVAKDKRVGPPRTLRWDCGPSYCRSHEMDVSLAAAVIDGGVLFAIIDKGPAGTIGKKTPDKWVLEARNAFNGILLWERPIPNWSWRQWKPELLELKEWHLIAQRRLIPATLPRRLVAVDGKVYATLGVNAPVSILDAATGRTIREIKGTEGVDEILLANGILAMVKRPHLRETALAKEMSPKRQASRSPMPVKEDACVLAADATSGKILWNASTGTVIPYTLTVENGRVFAHTGKTLLALDLKDGAELWRTHNQNASANRWDSRHTLLAHDDVLLLSTPKKCEAFDAASGKLLWTGKGGRGTAFNTTPVDMFVIDDLVWFTSGKQCEGKNLYTGAVEKQIALPKHFLSPGHHLRCYRAKATTRYILDNKRGIEFMDIQEKNHQKNDWVRGACRYGIIPANGLIYSTPTPCSCYQTVLLKGFNALSDALPPSADMRHILQKGVAFGQVPKDAGRIPESGWPTLRGNSAREGSVPGTVGPDIKRDWSRKLGGELTQPIVVGKRLYVASRESSTLFALDAKTGVTLWSRTMPAEVDSPPTYWKGQLLLGCRDGWAYNLRAADGAMVWRFRAAPSDRQIVSCGRLESSWPVNGNVLVVDGTAYVAAGRNTYLDGGIYMYGLDVDSGAIRCTQHLSNPVMDNEKPYDPHQLEGAMPDIMVFDGKTISMQSKTFDLDLNPVEKPAASHIYASGGFLDDQTWHRNIWLYTSGWTIMNKNASTFPNAGQMLVHAGNRSYGIKYFTQHTGQSMVFYPEEQGYKLFCDRDDKSWNVLLSDYLAGKGKKGNRRKSKSDSSIWSTWIPLRVRAMVKAGNTLFVSGAPDKVPDQDPLAPFEHRGKGILQAVSTETGEKIKEYTLAAPPVFDGLISANGNIFISLENGTIESW